MSLFLRIVLSQTRATIKEQVEATQSGQSSEVVANRTRIRGSWRQLSEGTGRRSWPTDVAQSEQSPEAIPWGKFRQNNKRQTKAVLLYN